MEIFISSPAISSPADQEDVRHQNVRRCISETCIHAWLEVQRFTMYIESRAFKQRHRWAEEAAEGKVYCLADDDCLPRPDLSLPRMAELFTLYPDYGLICLADVHGNVKNPREPVIPANAPGGIRFIRKGVVTAFPQNFSGDDTEYHELVVKAGFKVGICPEYERLHLGLWHSTWQRKESK